MEKTTKIGVIGCGNISDIYLTNLARFDFLEVVACADLIKERAEAKAVAFGIREACTPNELLADPDIDMVLNLTVPKAHAQVSQAALQAGKHVYTEKPLATTREDGRQLIEMAASQNLLVGCAPDTFLGAGLQTCRQIIDSGAIGMPVAATAFMTGRGPEDWHPDPAFFYQSGGGPMLDMGPYYLTAFVHLLGPIRRVTGLARISFPERTITSQPHYGKVIGVEIPTHIVGVLDFDSGAVGTLITSFDVWSANLPRLEIYGSEGTLSVPDPNTFGGPVQIYRAAEGEWSEVPLAFANKDNSRGLGMADMVLAIREGRTARASGEMALHVLDVMQSIGEASEKRRYRKVHSKCKRPEPLPPGLKNWELE